MELQRITACIAATVVATGCSAHGASGTYIAHGRDFVEMLQITEGHDGQLLGSLVDTTLKQDGAITQDATNISGVADEHSITLVAKSPIPLIPGVNMSGTISGGVITITLPHGQEQFTTADPRDYQAAVQQLQKQGAAIRQQKRLAEYDASVAAFNTELTDYATRVQQPRADQEVAEFHAFHTKALERAQHGLELQRQYPKGSFNAGRVAFDIGQIQYQLQAYNYNWDEYPEQARSHVRQFDTTIAQSLCHIRTEVLSCAQQPAAIRNYQTARSLVLRRGEDIEFTLKKDDAAMKDIVARGEAYASQ